MTSYDWTGRPAKTSLLFIFLQQGSTMSIDTELKYI